MKKMTKNIMLKGIWLQVLIILILTLVIAYTSLYQL